MTYVKVDADCKTLKLSTLSVVEKIDNALSAPKPQASALEMLNKFTGNNEITAKVVLSEYDPAFTYVGCLLCKKSPQVCDYNVFGTIDMITLLTDLPLPWKPILTLHPHELFSNGQ